MIDVNSLIFFNRMLMSTREAKSSEVYLDNTRLCSWITTKVSYILLEEFPGIVREWLIACGGEPIGSIQNNFKCGFWSSYLKEI